MEKIAPTDHPVHELIARRWSPRAYSDRPVAPETLASVLEAARWAASSYNAQPWRFLVAARGEAAFDAIVGSLVGFNQAWAASAPILMVSFARTHFEHNGAANRHALHDTGQATAHLALQAAALGLQAHQMAGFDAERVRRAFAIPDGFEPVAAIALGYPGAPDRLPDAYREREVAPRERKPLTAIAFHGSWETPLTPPAAAELTPPAPAGVGRAAPLCGATPSAHG